MLLEPDVLAQSAQIDPQIVEFLRAKPMTPVNWDDYVETRANMAAMEQMSLQQLGPPEATLEEGELQIAMRDGYRSTIKVHKPAAPPANGRPLIVLSFGGGWIFGSRHQMTPVARAFVRAFRAVVVTIDYRLAPEYPFPTSQYDCWDSVKWLATHASEIGADPTTGFVLGGISAGATNSAVTSTLAAQEKLNPPVTGQWLCVPAIMEEAHVPDKYRKYFLSRVQNKATPILAASDLERIREHVKWEMDSPLRFPTLTKTPLSELPPTFIQADGMDPVRDDALIYDEMLKESGVQTRINFYPGCPHAHFSFMPGIEVSNRGLVDMMTGMAWLLRMEITAEEVQKALMPQ